MQPSCLELEIELVCFTLKKCIIRGLIVIFYTRKLTREIPFEIEIITDSILEMTHILCLLVTNNYGSISISNLKSTYTPWLFLKQIAGWSGTPSDIMDCLKTLLFPDIYLCCGWTRIYLLFYRIDWLGWRSRWKYVELKMFFCILINFTKKTFNFIYRSMFGSTLFNLSCFVYVCWIGRNRLFEIRANRGES